MICKKIKIAVNTYEETADLYTYFLDNSIEMDMERKRPVIVICPGGGYAMTSDREAAVPCKGISCSNSALQRGTCKIPSGAFTACKNSSFFERKCRRISYRYKQNCSAGIFSRRTSGCKSWCFLEERFYCTDTGSKF